ncbi:zinc ribbon domain-containing protein [Haloquadratum walsbyi]|jgi:hypothetical protein|uniref:Small CPxCG-related zinc finger protein n=1 Tax=Haloquadratum walsbyi (strain DSM 16854 / JCM 12705 / C23) TaxID=768065 RepID=G0LNA2_HALWC|nr:zinc ribbon domain-containing protein [Haloquadratum walsbyi]CCC41908.1 small CPxCG-related zinc finger protein [Haloquadratum walsbyi C23]
MSYCSGCGTELSGEETFCPDCGESIDKNNTVETNLSESADTNPAKIADTSESEDDGVQWKQVGMAGSLALIPAFIAYLALSIATGGDPVGIVFLISLPVFGYLLYQRSTFITMIGGMCYYLSIEFLLSPFFLLLYTVAFASDSTTTAAGQAGAAIGGFALTIAAFVVGLPLAIAFYLVSRRLDQT